MIIGFIILGGIGVFVIILLLQKLQTPGPAPLAVTPGPAPLAVTPGPAPLAVTPVPAPLAVTPVPAPLASYAQCPSGKVKRIDGNRCDPISCPAGYKITNNNIYLDNSCEPCPVNTYKSDNTLGPCTACPSDKVTMTNASVSLSDCKYYSDTGFYSFIDKSWINTGDPRNAYINGTNYTKSTLDGCSSACQSTPTCGGFTRYKDDTAGAIGPCWFFTPDAITNNIVPNKYGAAVYKKN